MHYHADDDAGAGQPSGFAGSSIPRTQQSVMLSLDGSITFAGGLPQTSHIPDLDMTPAVANNSGLLQRVGDDRDRVALHADHSRQAFLGQRQAFAVGQVARAQQP